MARSRLRSSVRFGSRRWSTGMPSRCRPRTVVSAWRRWTSPLRSNVSPVDVALRFLAQRPRSEREVRSRLRRAGVDETAIEATLLQLRGHRLVDDDAFARYWVEQRQTFRPRGGRLLRSELAQRGIARPLADEATAPLEDSAEEDAYRAAAKRAYQLRTL